MEEVQVRDCVVRRKLRGRAPLGPSATDFDKACCAWRTAGLGRRSSSDDESLANSNDSTEANDNLESFGAVRSDGDCDDDDDDDEVEEEGHQGIQGIRSCDALKTSRK